jgi:hypothetical protein
MDVIKLITYTVYAMVMICFGLVLLVAMDFANG